MTKLLKHAFAEAQKLPPERQDAFAAFLLAELADDKRWDDAFARSQDVLARLAAEALEEDRRGLTLPLDKVLDDADADDSAVRSRP